MNIINVATQTRFLTNKSAKRCSTGRGVMHACWMLQEIINGNVKGTKAHRWLGYAQSILVDKRETTLEQIQSICSEGKI